MIDKAAGGLGLTWYVSQAANVGSFESDDLWRHDKRQREPTGARTHREEEKVSWVREEGIYNLWKIPL